MKVNVVCPSCRRRYSADVQNDAGVHTVHCPYCSVPYNVTVASNSRSASPVSSSDAVARKVRRCEVASSVVWIVVGIVQCVMLYTAAAGIWNVVNAIVRLRNVKNVVSHNPQVVPYFEQRKVWLIVLAVVNIILGGVVGIVLVLIDWFVRDYVLRNRSAFEV